MDVILDSSGAYCSMGMFPSFLIQNFSPWLLAEALKLLGNYNTKSRRAWRASLAGHRFSLTRLAGWIILPLIWRKPHAY